jgi:hypothetical protein
MHKFIDFNYIMNNIKENEGEGEEERDNIKYLILNNKPIEDKLHVIAVVSNPCNFKIRYKLMDEFIERMEKEPDVILYIVELVYCNQPFEITSADNKRHLQLRGKIPLWHKENMINLGIKNLLPANWKAVAWIDADIEFDNPHWAINALKILNGGKDIIQLFVNVFDMNFDEEILNIYTGFGYQYCKKLVKGMDINYWHPGYAWACNRTTYDQIGEIYQSGILGAGDNILSHGFFEHETNSLKPGMTQIYLDHVKQFQNKMKGLKLGYGPGSIRHFFHGRKENRNYWGREDILIKYRYDPTTFIDCNSDGLIIPSSIAPKEFIFDIFDYFKNRNEDEMLLQELETSKNQVKVLKYKLKFILHEFEKMKKNEKNEKNDRNKVLHI